MIITRYFAIFFILVALTPKVLALQKVALVIGNANYSAASVLDNPKNDANDIASSLRRLGYDVSLHIDLGQMDLNKAIWDFQDKLSEQVDVALFYYAGHGMEVSGTNYLIPVDADIVKPKHITRFGINVDGLIGDLKAAGAKANVVILDACRNDPFRKSDKYRPGTRGANSRGLRKLEIGGGQNMLIAFATSPGSVAQDGIGKNGLYTKHFLSVLHEPGMEVGRMFREIRKRVMEESNNNQSPWVNSALVDDVYLGTLPMVNKSGLDESMFMSDLLSVNEGSLALQIKKYKHLLDKYPSLDRTVNYKSAHAKLAKMKTVEASLKLMSADFDKVKRSVNRTSKNEKKSQLWEVFINDWPENYEYTLQDDNLIREALKRKNSSIVAWHQERAATAIDKVKQEVQSEPKVTVNKPLKKPRVRIGF